MKVFTLCLFVIFLTGSLLAQVESLEKYTDYLNPDNAWSPIVSEKGESISDKAPSVILNTEALTFYTDRPTFDADFPGLPVEDFEGTNVPQNSVNACPGAFNSTTNNACFSPGAILDGISIDNLQGGSNVVLTAGFLGVPSTIVGPNTFVDDLEISFPNNDVNAVGLDLYDPGNGPQTFNVEIFGISGSLGTTTTTSGVATGVFWGVGSTDIITRIVFTSLTPGAADGELVDDIAFGQGAPPEISVSPTSFYEVLEVGETTTATLTISNIATPPAQDLLWEIVDQEITNGTLKTEDGLEIPVNMQSGSSYFSPENTEDAQSKTIHSETLIDETIERDNSQGNGIEALGDIVSSFAGPTSSPLGITWDGSNLWIGGQSSSSLYKVTTSGSVLSTIPSPGSDHRGLAWDGQYLWHATAGSDIIYKINPTNGTVLNSFTYTGSGNYPNGITFDGNHLWVSAFNSPVLTRIDPVTGSILGTIPAPSNSGRGLTWDGTYLWYGDQNSNRIFQVNSSDGTVIQSFVSTISNPGLAFDGQYLWASSYGGGTIYQIDIEFSRACPWLTVAPAMGTTPAGGSTPVTLTFDATGLAPGIYYCELVINSNDPNNSNVNVPVTLEVIYPKVLIAKDDIEISKMKDSWGTLCSNDDIHIYKGANNILYGDLFAVQDILLEKKNTVDGDATAGRYVTLQGNATVNGAISAPTPVPPIPIPHPIFTAGGADIAVPTGGFLALAPGSYGFVELKIRSELELSAGDYYFEELELDNKSTVSYDLSGGAITVNITNKLYADARASFEIAGAGSSKDITVNVIGTSHVRFRKNVTFVGNLIAPFARVNAEKNFYLRGAIYAFKIYFQNGATFMHHAAPILPIPDRGEIITEEEISTLLPTRYQLHPSHPNPFNPSTTIQYDLPVKSQVMLVVYNTLGQEVARLVNGQWDAGIHEVEWTGRSGNGKQVASGMYIYRLYAVPLDGSLAPHMSTQKMLLLK